MPNLAEVVRIEEIWMDNKVDSRTTRNNVSCQKYVTCAAARSDYIHTVALSYISWVCLLYEAA